MNWIESLVTFGEPPLMEGYQDNTTDMFGFPVINCWGTYNRSFGPGDIYLTCRLDGPKAQGQSAVFAVRQMLERSKRASAATWGINPLQAVVVLDDANNPIYGDDNGRVYNLDASVNYAVYDADQSQPYDARNILVKDDYVDCFSAMTGVPYTDNTFNVGHMSAAQGLCVALDRRPACRSCQLDLQSLVDEGCLEESAGVVALACYGKNGDEGSGGDYLFSDQNDCGALYNVLNGAVFTSIESFNGLTMFSDAPTSQAKIIDFIEIGGAGAIGHAFEPVQDAVVDNLYFFYNYFADDDHDSRADLAFVEAAFTAIPFLSWAEVVIGDPLMRIAYGPGESEAWTQFSGDVNGDDRVNIIDISKVRRSNGGMLHSQNPLLREKYSDLCDINRDGRTNIIDIVRVKSLNGTVK
ncbi:MAG: dockerin type I repeat-containing protein, partial [Planctomycetota bacterium]|jgi:hypothetical protein